MQSSQAIRSLLKPYGCSQGKLKRKRWRALFCNCHLWSNSQDVNWKHFNLAFLNFWLHFFKHFWNIGSFLAHFFQINCSLTKRVDFVAAVVFIVAIQCIIKQKINKCSVNSFSFSLRLRLELEFAHSWVHPWTLTASFHRAHARIRCSRHHGSAF